MIFDLTKDSIEAKQDYFVGVLDGTMAPKNREFLVQISKSFNFPDYFGNNYNSLGECLNDLDWIEESNYILHIKNYNDFLINESEEELLDTLSFLYTVALEWASVPNFDGEDQFRKKSDFKILIDWTEKAQNDLNKLNIPFSN